MQPYQEYIKAINQVVGESQLCCEDAQRSYVEACRSRATEQVLENAYCNYMKALLEAWGAEETRQRTEQAHLNYLSTLQDGFSQEKQCRYESALREALSPEIAAKCLSAYHDYVQALKAGWQAASLQNCGD